MGAEIDGVHHPQDQVKGDCGESGDDAHHNGEEVEKLIVGNAEMMQRNAEELISDGMEEFEDDQYGTVAQVDAIRDQVTGPVETRMLPACGHSPHRDQCEQTLDAMVGFLKNF